MQVRKFPKVILDIGLDISASVETNITSIVSRHQLQSLVYCICGHKLCYNFPCQYGSQPWVKKKKK